MKPVIEYLMQLILLDRLEDIGLDQRDYELADELRDEMDTTWELLDDRERIWVGEVSQRLANGREG